MRREGEEKDKGKRDQIETTRKKETKRKGRETDTREYDETSQEELD